MGGALTSPDKDPPLVCGELPSELKILSTAASASVTMAAGLAPLVLGSALPLTAAFFAAGPPRAGCGMSPACSAGLLLGGLRPAPGDSLGCSLLVPGLLLGGLRAAPGGVSRLLLRTARAALRGLALQSPLPLGRLQPDRGRRRRS
mmetsp:Transcript_120759/g.276810  ORF Transcript_120759/g.276810 Transcript_120759/m.276810 type:complete len:146 (-) Transcript_120759:1584-2021(-)